VTYAVSARAGEQTRNEAVQGRQQQGGPVTHQTVYEALAIRILAPSPVKEE
jgi:hypothetical protein